MSNTVWMGVSVAALGVASYVALASQESVGADARQSASAEGSSARSPKPIVAQQLRGARLEHLEGEVSKLTAKLAVMEANAAAATELEEADSTEADNAEADNAEADSAEADSTEERLASHMTRTLRQEPPNREWSGRVERAFLDGTSSIEGVDMESVRCGERFCQASFFMEEGDMTALRKMMELPVIEGEAFTLSEPDGRTSIYFGGRGVSLGELDPEAGDGRHSFITTTVAPGALTGGSESN